MVKNLRIQLRKWELIWKYTKLIYKIAISRMNFWYKCNVYLHLYLKCISKVVDYVIDIWKNYSRRILNGSLLSLTQEICWNFSEIYSLNAEMKQQWFQWTRRAFISKQNVCLVSWSPFLDVTNSGNLLRTFTITFTLLVFYVLQWTIYINQ